MARVTVRLWSGVVLAGLMLSGTSVPADAEIVTATPPGTFTRLSVGDDYGCALTPAGVAGCWGEDYGRGDNPGHAARAVSRDQCGLGRLLRAAR